MNNKRLSILFMTFCLCSCGGSKSRKEDKEPTPEVTPSGEVSPTGNEVTDEIRETKLFEPKVENKYEQINKDQFLQAVESNYVEPKSKYEFAKITLTQNKNIEAYDKDIGNTAIVYATLKYPSLSMGGLLSEPVPAKDWAS